MNRKKFMILFNKLIASDSFNRTNGAVGIADTGQTWIISAGGLSVSSNKCVGSSANSNVGVIDVGMASKSISADVTLATGELVNLYTRFLDGSNNIRIRISETNIVVRKTIAGNSTDIGTYSYAFSGTHNVKFASFGNVHTVYVDGASIGSATDDNATKTYTRCGMEIYKNSAVPSANVDNVRIEVE